MNPSHRKIIIIGGGPAGYTAAIYASRANLDPMLLQGPQPGGQLTTTTEVENFPGFRLGIQGPELVEEMAAQAFRLGTEIRPETVQRVDLGQRPFRIETDRGVYFCDALIIATGASAKWLGLGKDEALSRTGGGVSACATCDGFFFRGKEVAVVGGGDTAAEDALFLSRFASKVHLIHRRGSLRASKVMQERVLSSEKIILHWHQSVLDLVTRVVPLASGDSTEKLESLTLQDRLSDELTTLPVDGLFVAIGHQPNTALFQGQLALDEHGYLQVEKGSSRSSLAGVFACGDVQDPIYRQAITSAGSGCMAAIDAERWLGDCASLVTTQLETQHV